MRTHARQLWLLLTLLIASPVEGQRPRLVSADAPEPDASARLVQAFRLDGPSPSVDGVLDEAVWGRAEVAAGFVQMRPRPGEASAARTEARVLFDDDALYVGMRLYDDPDSVVAQVARRDASDLVTDWAHVLVDSYDDNRTAFRFSVSPGGTKKDVLHFNDHSEDVNWDAVWDAAVRVDSLGWTAELRIPLSQLRFSSEGEAGLVWGVNFGREIARLGEWSWWSPVLPSQGGTVSQSGELRGLAGIEAPRRLELLPYAVARLTRAPGESANPFWEESAAGLAVGGDLRYGLTSELTLSATINPDFGQVEADPSEVNLSAYETFFPEKRPFFMEGSNLFSYVIGDDNQGEQLFYSRRIGRAPQRAVGGPGTWVDAPEATTILGAAKITGRTSGGWSLGVLSAVTDREEARLAASPGGPVATAAVEPLTSYAVASVARDFRGGGSTIRLMGTALHRDLGDDGAFGFLRSAAYSAGVHGRHRFRDDTWEADMLVAGSHIRGGAGAIALVQASPGHYFQRPDAEHVELDGTRTSLSGAMANVFVGRIGGGDGWRGGIGGRLRTPGLELNDMGFMNEADQALAFGSVRYHRFEPQGIFRSWTVGFNPSLGFTTAGERTWTQIGHWANWELKNFWQGGWWIGLRPFAALNPGMLRGGPAVRRPADYRLSYWMNTDRRNALSGNLNAWGGTEPSTGSWDWGVSTGLTFRPSPRLNVSLSPSYSRRNATAQYVGQPSGAGGGTRYLVGDLDQHTLGLITRLNYTLSPTLSFELYAQPFLSAGDYVGFLEVADPRAAAYDDRYRRLAAPTLSLGEDGYTVDADGDGTTDYGFPQPDFNFRQMRGNAVLRWEYMPGSTLFLVWNQSRTAFLPGVGSFDVGRDAGRLFNEDAAFPTPVTNVLLVKVSYWVNP